MLYLLRGQSSSTAVAFGLAGDQTFRDESQFTAVFTVPNNGDMMPLSVVNSGVFSEW